MLSLIAAPSNLGLRPPEAGAVPGTAKAPEALREAGLYQRFLDRGAIDAGVVLPGRYRDDVRPGSDRNRNQDAIVEHARRLADRIGHHLDRGRVPLVIGGDCGLLVGAGLAVKARGRFGLVHLDGHTDFRHPGNSSECFSLAGEDLAAAIGRHRPELADIDGAGPYFRAADTVHIGCRDDDRGLVEAGGQLAGLIPAARVLADGPAAAARAALTTVTAPGLAGYWLHLDVDILDPTVMPAVDSPSPGGLSTAALIELLRALAPGAAGAQVTVFDPDLDPDGRHAALLTDILTEGLRFLGHEQARSSAG